MTLMALLPQAIHADPTVNTLHVGTSLAGGTSTTAPVPGTSTNVTLTAQSSSITISLPSGGASYLYFNPFGGAATTSSFAIPAGSNYTFEGLPNILTFTVLGSSASGNYSVLAH